jgi:hypothetical protein
MEEEYLIRSDAKKKTDAKKAHCSKVHSKYRFKKTRQEQEREKRVHEEKESTRKASAFNNMRAIKLLSVGQKEKFWRQRDARKLNEKRLQREKDEVAKVCKFFAHIFRHMSLF